MLGGLGKNETLQFTRIIYEGICLIALILDGKEIPQDSIFSLFSDVLTVMTFHWNQFPWGTYNLF